MALVFGRAISASEMVKIFPPHIKTDMDLLMARMRVPTKEKESPKFEVTNISTRVTREPIDRIIDLHQRTTQEIHPEEHKYSVEILGQLKDILGVDLAGYFDVEVSIRDKDAVVRLFYKGNALGVGVHKSTATALADAIGYGVVPSLKQLQRDLKEILEKLPWIGAK
jgi:hypothetical protein